MSEAAVTTAEQMATPVTGRSLEPRSRRFARIAARARRAALGCI